MSFEFKSFEKEPEIVFLNTPKLSLNKADDAENERRISLVHHQETFLKKHPLFQGAGKVSVSFFDTGMASLVSVLDAAGEKHVLKIPLIRNWTDGEAEFLRVWEEAGVSVPHVEETGVIDSHPYILMNYIDAPRLRDRFTPPELIQKEVHKEVGETLRKMHEPHGKGYGSVVNGKAEYTTLSEWLLNGRTGSQLRYAREHNALSHTDLEKSIEILTNLTKGEEHSSYCHDDLGVGNIFATNPITIFDPIPRFNTRYIDIGRCMVKLIEGRHPAIAWEQLLQGYFKEEGYNAQLLHAGVIISYCTRFRHWHKNNNEHGMTAMEKYLAEHQHLLKG